MSRASMGFVNTGQVEPSLMPSVRDKTVFKSSQTKP